MYGNFRRRVIHLDPIEVKDETLAALEAEIREQSDEELGDIESIRTIVLDDDDSVDGLDSHAIIFTKIEQP